MAIEFHVIAGGPRPLAPFSHAVETDGFVFVAGHVPDSSGAPGVLPNGIVNRTHAAMVNLRTVLAGLGLGFEHVVMARIYLSRFKEDYGAMNEAYRTYVLPERFAARTCTGVTGLAYDALIEIDLIARRPAQGAEALTLHSPVEYGPLA
jgi:2-iminobutanoate/2-iminopropanoate deaminase